MELQKIKQAMVKFVKDEEGLTVVEYAVAGSLIAAALILAFTGLGQAVGDVINELCTELGGQACSPAT